MIAVRGLHAFARKQGLAATDPAHEVSPPAPPRRLPKAISVAEVERLLDAAGSTADPDPRVLRDRALLEFLYGAGARISEAAGLDIDDLNLTPDPVVLLRGKGGKERVVPVGSYAVRALEAYLVRGRPVLAQRARGAAPGMRPAVFLNARGGRLHPAGRVGNPARGVGAIGPGARGLAAYAAALLRHPPAGRRRGHPGRAGIARTCLGDHHAGLHSRHGGQAPRGIRRRAPAGPGIAGFRK